MVASPNLPHQRVLVRLSAVLERWLDRTSLGLVVSDWDVRFLLDEVRRPDLVVALKEGSRLKLGVHGEGAPDLIVEILSPGQEDRDLGDKKDLYERCGVREYWVVDYARRRIHQFLPGKDGRYAVRTVVRGRIHSRVLKGFSLSLAGVFGVLDDLPKS